MDSNTNQIVFVVAGGTAIVLFLACVLIIYIVIFQKRQNRFISEKEMLRMNYEQMLLQTQLEIREQTLKNISQEIHDNIGQTLSLAKLNLNTINPGAPQVAEHKIAHSRELIGKAIKDLRILSKTLNTDAVLASGLVKAIELELESINTAEVFKTQLIITGSPVRADGKKELILFRIVQEALNNTIKHSGASEINIHANYNDEKLILTISDNGSGFNIMSNEEIEESGSGLRNMRNRAELIGGRFEIRSGVGSGSQILITIPTTENERKNRLGG